VAVLLAKCNLALRCKSRCAGIRRSRPMQHAVPPTCISTRHNISVFVNAASPLTANRVLHCDVVLARRGLLPLATLLLLQQLKPMPRWLMTE
jgi:hypothetical protein